jgi:hypothetical protein
MVRSGRIVAAIFLGGMLLATANWAVQDCSTGPSTMENCLWMHVRTWFGLPTSKLLRAGVLEAVGLVILAGLWAVFRYVWPRGPARNTVAAADSKHGERAHG